jgi:hypothetical protein
MGNGSTAPQFLTSELDDGEWSALYPCRFIPEKDSPVLTGCDIGWVPELVFTPTPLINYINIPNIGFSSTKSHPVYLPQTVNNVL